MTLQRAHARTVEVLSLTLTMPAKLEVLHTFLGIVSSCTSVTDMRMDMRNLIGHQSYQHIRYSYNLTSEFPVDLKCI